ncbi:transposase [Streptomyces sp. NPDC002559]
MGRKSSTRKRYTAEFKKDAVELVRSSGRTVTEVAREFGAAHLLEAATASARRVPARPRPGPSRSPRLRRPAEHEAVLALANGPGGPAAAGEVGGPGAGCRPRPAATGDGHGRSARTRARPGRARAAGQAWSPRSGCGGRRSGSRPRRVVRESRRPEAGIEPGSVSLP